MKRILSGLLIAAMLLGGAAGCSDTKREEETEENAAVMPQTPVPEEAPETDPPEYTDPGKDYEGATFTTAAIDYYSQGGGNWVCQNYCEAYTDETTGEILNDAIYERNEKVSETLNVKMATFSLTSYGSAGTEIRDALLGGETSVDLCLENGSSLPTLLSSGLLQNLYNFDRVDFSHSWWDQTSVDEFTFMNTLLAVTGDISLGISLSPITFFFNKQIVSDHNLEDPYTLVREGRWTFDTLIGMSETVAADVNGNGKEDLEEDRFGIALEPGSMGYAIYAGGVKLTKKDADGVPFLDVDEESIVSMLDVLQPFFNEGGVTMFSHKISGYSNVFRELFLPSLMENRLLFYDNQLLVAMNLREMDSDFGILPHPKRNEEQADYLCPVSYWWATFAVVPKVNSRSDLTGDMMEAMGYFSQQLVTPAYMEKTIQGKTLRDEDSLEMLDIILNHRVYELAVIYDWGGINSMFSQLSTNASAKFSSAYKSVQKMSNKALDKTINEIRESLGQ